MWDTVLAASAGFRFAYGVDQALTIALLGSVTLITPNISEALLLSGKDTVEAAGAWLAQHGNVLIKGGHALQTPGTDYLYLDGVITMLTPGAIVPFSKHGSGCILSAAIAAGIAQGLSITDACRQGKQYMESILANNPGLLAYHYV